jgi:hypothetical protein
MEAILKQKRQASPPPLSKMSGDNAANEILSSPFLDISEVGFDEVEAKRLGIKLGSRVAIRPDDTGKLNRPMKPGGYLMTLVHICR